MPRSTPSAAPLGAMVAGAITLADATEECGRDHGIRSIHSRRAAGDDRGRCPGNPAGAGSTAANLVLRQLKISQRSHEEHEVATKNARKKELVTLVDMGNRVSTHMDILRARSRNYTASVFALLRVLRTFVMGCKQYQQALSGSPVFAERLLRKCS